MKTFNSTPSTTTTGRFLTEATYNFKILEQPEHKLSAAKNNMYPIKCESFGNDPLQTEQGEVDINGIKVTLWALAEEGKMADLNALLAQMGVAAFGIDEQNVIVNLEDGEPVDFVGAEFIALAASKKEDKKDADKKVIINPVTEVPFTITRHNINEVC